MKRIILFSTLAIILAFSIPVVYYALAGRDVPSEEAPLATPEASEPLATPAVTANSQGESVIDSDISFTVLNDGKTTTWAMSDFLPLALAGEMPASFDSEALKAQAVALRSYILCSIENPKSSHPDADICTNSNCCMACADIDDLKEVWGSNFDKYYAKICSAVSDTDGQYLVYDGNAILAVFHSSSYVCTEDGQNLWSYRPYLISVPSPETNDTVTNLKSTVEVSADDFKKTILSVCPNADLSGLPSTWLGEIIPNSTGRVESINVGGEKISGTAMRTMFSLRSTNFSVSYNGEIFIFEVEGYGHGVGMSQYGANLLAKQGDDYSEILKHYYPGTELVVSVKFSSKKAAGE